MESTMEFHGKTSAFNYPLFSPRRTNRRTFMSSSSKSSLFLVLVALVLSLSKSSLAKDELYYHPDKIPYNSDAVGGDGNPIQHESNSMEFISTSTTASFPRSDEVPIVASISNVSTSTVATTTTTLSSSSSAATSRTTDEIEKAPPGFSTRVACNENEMIVDVLSSATHKITEAYLQGLKNYPDPSCTPTSKGPSTGHHMQFRLSLSDLTFYRCGTNLIINKITGTRTYYNRLDVVVLEKSSSSEGMNRSLASDGDVHQHGSGTAYDDDNYVYNTQTVLIKCQFANLTAFNHNNRIRRDVLPAGFQEADVLRVDRILERKAPDPMLTMRVRQNGRVIGHELLVHPGTPLTMEVAIDDAASKEIYGILMSQMDVTDNAGQDEIIMLNGCSVDPYLFENFKTTDSDLLTAQFKAFKFPDSNYVLFRGTVNVCLEQCEPTDCSNGQRGYGRRRRRDISSQEQGRLYEVQMTTLIRMANSELDNNEMNPYILGGGSKSPPSQHHHHDHRLLHHQLNNNQNAMYSLHRKAREDQVDQVDFVVTNRSISQSSTSPSHAVLLFLSVITSSVFATTLVLVRASATTTGSS